MSRTGNPVPTSPVRAAFRALLAVVAGLLALPTALLMPAAATTTTTAQTSTQTSAVDATVFYPPHVVGQFKP